MVFHLEFSSATSEWAQGIFSKITFLKSVRSKEKDEVCHSFLVEIFTKSLHRGGVYGQPVPNQFGPHGQMFHKDLVPMDKWSPSNLVSLDKWSLEYSICPGGQAVGIRKYGDRIGWGPFVQEDQFYGDRLSTGTGSRGLKVRGSNGFGTKCIAAIAGLDFLY
jgi:hypothetical protein